MQAFSSLPITDDYNAGMKTGRPAKHPRTAFGERVHAAREAAGLSQFEVAEQLGLSQNAYAMWERHPVALRPDQIEQLAAALGVSVDALFGKAPLEKQSGPMGRAKKVFESVSQLPRRKQTDVLDLVESVVRVHERARLKKQASAAG